MWNIAHSILCRKAEQGLEIWVLYDDIGSFLTLPKNYTKRLEAEGIYCRVFNPFRPVLSSKSNWDHRKSCPLTRRPPLPAASI